MEAPAAETETSQCDAAALRADLEAAEREELHRRNQVAQECELFEVLIEITNEIARRDTRPAARARYAYVIGVVYREELHDLEGAERAFRRALEADPEYEPASEALDSLRAR